MGRGDVMTSKERWEAVVNRQIPDRLPNFYRSTDEFTQKLMKHFGCADYKELFSKLHIDEQAYVWPRYAGPPIPDREDFYGCRYRDIKYATGVYRECCFNPLADCETIKEIDSVINWPTADLYDYSGIKDQLNKNSHLPIIIGGWEPYLVYKHLRGEERGYTDMIEYPEIVHHIMGKLFEFHFGILTRTLEMCGEGDILLCAMGEDLGSQTSLMYSPKHIREYFFPYHKKFFAPLRERKIKIQWHTDGSAREILPELIELGTKILDPVQWRCAGMEREGLKKDFGSKLIFHGAVDNQYTLPFGSVKEVREEVRENFEIIGRNGGYILGPCHNIQPVGPVENVVAMYETCYNECRY